MREKRLIDAAVLISTKFLTGGNPSKPLAERDDFLAIKRGAILHLFYEPFNQTQVVRKQIGDTAFVAAVISSPSPERFARAYVCLKLAKNGPHKLLSYHIPSRVPYHFTKDKTARLRMDVLGAEKIEPCYGRSLNRSVKSAA